jgi:hypothetical protein
MAIFSSVNGKRGIGIRTAFIHTLPQKEGLAGPVPGKK